MSYAALKFIHVGCVAISYSLFFLRGLWLLRGSPAMRQRWVRIAPHTVDSVLLASAITLAVQLHLSPLGTPWLLAKIIALLLYIVLGEVALHHGKTYKMKLMSWVAAQAVFIYILGVALTKNALPWQAL